MFPGRTSTSAGSYLFCAISLFWSERLLALGGRVPRSDARGALRGVRRVARAGTSASPRLRRGWLPRARGRLRAVLRPGGRRRLEPAGEQLCPKASLWFVLNREGSSGSVRLLCPRGSHAASARLVPLMWVFRG